MNTRLQLLKKFPASDLYRLIVNGQFHKTQKGWLGYELREHGSLAGAFAALKYAMSHELTHQHISAELLKNIHQQVSQPIINPGFRTNPMNPGKFRGDITNFFLVSDHLPFGYCNAEGLQELIDFVHRHKTMGSGIFISKRSVTDIENDRSMGVYRTQEEVVASYAQVRDNMRDAADASDTVSFDRLNIGDAWHYRAPSAEHIETLIERVCEHYNSAMIMAQNSEEKLRVIVSHIQEIERIHPFTDGNGRTSYILLQRMLIQNGFLPTMMFNPNHIDGFNLDAVIDEVKQGIAMTQALIDDPTRSLFDYKTPTKEFTLSDVIPDDQAYYLPQEITDPITHTIQQFYEAEKDLSDFIQSIPLEEELTALPTPLTPFENKQLSPDAALPGREERLSVPLEDCGSGTPRPNTQQLKSEFCTLFLTKFKDHTNSTGIKKMIKRIETSPNDTTLMTLGQVMMNIASPLKDRSLSKFGLFSCIRQAAVHAYTA